MSSEAQTDEDDRIEQLEARIEQLEAQDSLASGTVPISRRGLLQGGAALGIGALGGSVLSDGDSGRVAAQTASGQVGTDSDRVDLYGNLVDAASANIERSRTGGEPVHNVKYYGAKGDGLADDTGAIQTAFNAAAGGGSVYFPTGTYLHDDISVGSNVTVVGDGKSSHTIFTGDSEHPFHAKGESGITFFNLRVDGDKESHSHNFSSIYFYECEGCTVYNCWLTGARRNPDDYSGDGMFHGEGVEFRSSSWCSAMRNRAYENHYDGIKSMGDHNIIQSNHSYNNGKSGIQVAWRKDENHDYKSKKEAEFNVVANNTIELPDSAGPAAPDTPGITFHSTRHCLAEGNVIVGTDPTNTDQYGLVHVNETPNHHNSYKNNTIRTVNVGISIGGGNNIKAIGNSISNFGDVGLLIEDGDTATAFTNVISSFNQSDSATGVEMNGDLAHVELNRISNVNTAVVDNGSDNTAMNNPGA